MVIGTASAEVKGNQTPAEVDVLPRYGAGILGLVGDNGRVEGAVELMELDAGGFCYTQVITKPKIEEGWDRESGEVTPVHAATIKGSLMTDVRVSLDKTTEGEEERIKFVVFEQIAAAGIISAASLTEYEGPVKGVVGRHLPNGLS